MAAGRASVGARVRSRISDPFTGVARPRLHPATVAGDQFPYDSLWRAEARSKRGKALAAFICRTCNSRARQTHRPVAQATAR
jgi:hypothetical protein